MAKFLLKSAALSGAARPARTAAAADARLSQSGLDRTCQREAVGTDGRRFWFCRVPAKLNARMRKNLPISDLGSSQEGFWLLCRVLFPEDLTRRPRSGWSKVVLVGGEPIAGELHEFGNWPAGPVLVRPVHSFVSALPAQAVAAATGLAGWSGERSKMPALGKRSGSMPELVRMIQASSSFIRADLRTRRPRGHCGTDRAVAQAVREAPSPLARHAG